MEAGITAKQRRLCSLPQLGLVLFLSLSLQPLARGSYLLVTEFHTYKNSLHSFVNTSASPFTTHCCDGRDAPDCTDPCNTVLNYCFKEVGAVNSFANDSTVLRNCMPGGRSLTELVEHTDNIDFSNPPLSVSGSVAWTSVSNRGPLWPGGIQFFVRSVSDGEIVDYLSTNVYLKPGENRTNIILTGDHFGGSITFTVSFFLACTFDYYGDNCSLYCRPGSSREDGFYSCSREGARICNEFFGGSGCNVCDNGFEYPHCRPDVCVLLHPCMEGNCTDTGFDSYTCSCNDGFYGVNCSDPIPDMCSLLDPCQEGNCTNTPPEGYRCTCNEGFHGVNCSEAESVPDVDRKLIYLWLIGAGVVGILAPVVILSPLLLILCFTGLGSWRKKNKEYVNNPLYGDASAPASVTGTFKSETGTDHSSTVEVIHAGSTDTLTPPRMSCEAEPNYDIIPGNAVGTPVSRGVPPSLAGTFKSDDNSSYYTLSISTNESICPYSSLSYYDVPPPPLPARGGLTPGNSLKSESSHGFLEMTAIADEDSLTYYKHPIPRNPVTHSDLANNPQRNGTNGALWVPSYILLNQNLALKRSKTIGGHPRSGVRHSNSFKVRSRHRHHHHHHHHRRLCKTGSAGAYISPHHYQYTLEEPKMTPYGRRQGLPPVPPHGMRTHHLTSSCEDRKAFTLGAESSPSHLKFLNDHPHGMHTHHLTCSFEDRRAFTLGAESSPSHLKFMSDHPQFLSDHSQLYGSDSTVVRGEMGHSGWSMNTKDITAPMDTPKIVIGDNDADYDKVQDDALPNGVYDELAPNRTGYEHYDVPRKESSA